MRLRLKLGRLLRRLRKVKDARADFSKIFLIDKTLAHLWREYRHTLHEQRQVNSQTGQQETVALRATVPADTFFNPQAIVDNRLRTEFFKHLPGICTGLGIIGTFLGLIQGLSAFKVSENAQEVGKSIDALLHGVFEAFLVSAAAIAIAMAITLIEKFLISSLYRRTEAIAHRLDGMFEAGADSEYLERLVRSSEESASQAKILKDALVADLKTILSDLTQQQIQASRAVSTQIADSLRASFTEPLAQIASAVQQVSQDQGQAVTRLLTDVLANFSQQIQDLFSGQISGINRLQRQAIESLQATVTKLDQMVGGIDVASQRATEAMAAKMRDAIDAMESRLATINERSTALVEQMGSTTTDAIDKMTAGAASLYAAVGEFTKATQDVTAVMSDTAAASEALTRSAESITGAANELGRIVSDYRASRDVLERMLTELRATVENAKTEASLTTNILARIDGAATKLAQAQGQADTYLERISEVLAEAHQEFSDNMRKTLGDANQQFYDQLTRATQLLRVGIQELEVSLGSFNGKG
jgi:MotA/TolQ/ExbB proton channel family